MPRDRYGLGEMGQVLVTTDASGNGSASAVFAESYPAAPWVALVPSAADAGTRTLGTVSASGFSLVITGSDVRSGVVPVVWYAHERT